MRVASTSQRRFDCSYMVVHCIAIGFPTHGMQGLWLNYGECANSTLSVRIMDGVESNL